MSDCMLHVVMASTGEYSDRREQHVAAYLDTKLAQKHVELAQVRADELALWTDSDGERWCYSGALDKPVSEYDARLDMDYDGTRYYLAEVALLESVPATKESA